MEESDKPDPSLAQFDAAVDDFHAIRGRAIEAYADVELGLCKLFARFADVDLGVASSIFFRITNPRVVGEILDELLRKKYKDKYSAFWNSLDKHVR
jgi:hypothetical protein